MPTDHAAELVAWLKPSEGQGPVERAFIDQSAAGRSPTLGSVSSSWTYSGTPFNRSPSAE